MYIEALCVLQVIIWAAGNIFKMGNRLLPEMLLMLTFIIVAIAKSL